MIEPLFNYVLVIKDEQKTTSKGGIFIPDNSQEKPSTGVVVAVGPGKVHEQTGVLTPMTVKPNDRVFFLRLGGQKVVDDGKEYTIMKEDEILGIIH